MKWKYEVSCIVSIVLVEILLKYARRIPKNLVVGCFSSRILRRRFLTFSEECDQKVDDP